jgi:hypothetical protein
MQYALKIINLVNKRENYNIEAIKFNFQDAKVPIPANSFILTSYSLMYLKNEAEDFFVKLLDSDPIGGIFFEPIYEDQNGISTIDKHRKSYFKNCEYSTDFYSKFLKIITRKGYGIIFHEKNVLAHNLLCPLSVIGWKRL